MSETQYEFVADLAAETDPPLRGIQSHTQSRGGGIEVVLFAMAAGEQLSEHSAARPAIVHVLSGTGELIVAGDRHDLQPGAWLRMKSRTAHALVASTPLVFALYLLPGSADPAGLA